MSADAAQAPPLPPHHHVNALALNKLYPPKPSKLCSTRTAAAAAAAEAAVAAEVVAATTTTTLEEGTKTKHAHGISSTDLGVKSAKKTKTKTANVFEQESAE
ncbi:hypothetical protein H0H81_007871, partial [Sphagnurus paluster]